MVFPVVMYGCENWTVKKAECQRNDAFELRCLRRLLRVPWTARRANKSILKISPGCSLEGHMLKLKCQYFGPFIRRVDSLEKTLMLGGIGGRKWRGTKKPLDESERGERKRWLKAQHSENKDHGIQSHHSMQIDGETVETVTDFIFLGSKITADGDTAVQSKDTCSLEENLWPT